MCKNVEACLQMNGLIKCTVVPPKSLYHQVVPYRFNKKLLFCLFRLCVHDQNISEECQHFTKSKRALEGTWVIDEIRLAVEKVYKIIKIHEIYEPKTVQGGLFVEYINTFLKFKAEASGYPSWVRTPDDEDRYIKCSGKARESVWTKTL